MSYIYDMIGGFSTSFKPRKRGNRSSSRPRNQVGVQGLDGDHEGRDSWGMIRIDSPLVIGSP